MGAIATACGLHCLTRDLIVAPFKLVYESDIVQKSHSSWVSLQGKQRLEATQGCNVSQSEQYSMNAQAKKHLLKTCTSSLSRGSKSMASYVSGEPSQLLLPSSLREELPTSTMRTVNVADTTGKRVESLVHNASKAENTAYYEDSDPVIQNLVKSFWLSEKDQKKLCDLSTLGESSKRLMAFGGGTFCMHEFASFTSPALQDDDKKSETSDCSSNFRILSAAADASIVSQSESHEGNNSVSSSMECD